MWDKSHTLQLVSVRNRMQGKHPTKDYRQPKEEQQTKLYLVKQSQKHETILDVRCDIENLILIGTRLDPLKIGETKCT